ncbi:hypothetical protein AVEN_224712-1 [Araneus ventricosus]|uniref:Uncharacterized protein n=1 Tax=Araneus ventricosus TaxID=182803 RepID=A0A4Y2EWP1_ARAVE|nr:hypothetical protein AVEN_224712-1 [Araneus ventricosus]
MFDLLKFIVRKVKDTPDLVPSDFHLFPHLKKFLAGQEFSSDDEIKVNVQNSFSSQAAEFYEADMIASHIPPTTHCSSKQTPAELPRNSTSLKFPKRLSRHLPTPFPTTLEHQCMPFPVISPAVQNHPIAIVCHN